MSAAANPRPASVRATLIFLMLGNVAIGSGVLAPAAMINAMTVDLAVSAPAIGALVGWGAVLLCVGAPAFAFLTNRIGRRALLTTSLALWTIGHAASVLAPDYDTLFVARMLMISGAAIFTPQAASAVALMVPDGRRAASVAFVFMGWSLATAIAIPAMNILGEVYGWRTVYAGLAVVSLLATAGSLALVPARLYPARISLATWGEVLGRPAILLLLATTSFVLAGQFTLFPYLASELRRAADASTSEVGLALALSGGAGLIGAVLATRAVSVFGAPRTQLVCIAVMASGLAAWTVFAPALPLAMASIFVWGLGFGSAMSMQQSRLIAAGPHLASASVALNTSFLYLGQAVGAAIGGAVIARETPTLLAPAGLACIIAAFLASLWAWRRYQL